MPNNANRESHEYPLHAAGIIQQGETGEGKSDYLR